MNSKEYIQNVLDDVSLKNTCQPEFLQSVYEVLPTLEKVLDTHPEYKDAAILERLVEPDRQIIFRVPWEDDNGVIHVNRGYRVQFNNAIGPYKGGLRFHPSVNLSIIKFLGFEQTFKNSLTGLPIGGGKGGSDFDPRGKSDREVMRFCQSFMSELQKHIGESIDVPAGDIGVGAREIGYLFGEYKKIKNVYESGILTGKGLSYGGSLMRKEATGFGLIYFTQKMLEDSGRSFDGLNVVISGSGNVAIHAAIKAESLGAKVIAMSDSSGFIYDKDGIDIEIIKDIKEIKRGRISEYTALKSSSKYYPNSRDIWSIPCDAALPCATQNEIDLECAKVLVKNGTFAIGEGANMPSTPDAIKYFYDNNVLFAPAKAANAGGVATSALEMSQNSMRLSWSFNEVDSKLKDIMTNIYAISVASAKEYGMEGDLSAGANIAGFMKVATAMYEQGIV